MPNELVIFEGVAVALKEKAFGDDLALIVTEFPNKAQICQLAGETADLIALSGDYEPLRELITIKRLILYLSEIEDRIRPAATLEAEKYTGGGKQKSFEKAGAKVQTKKMPDEWNFNDCDSIIQRENKIAALKAEIKSIQSQLKIGPYVDPSTGAEYAPAVKIIEGQPNISITL